MRSNLILLLSLVSFCSFAQDEIFLENPSFEDFPRLSKTPEHWYDCGFQGTSPVDIHPVDDCYFGVETCPINGQTYLGMVTRDDETWEAIGQRLSKPLNKGKTYSFNISLARSDTYLSASALNPLSDTTRIHYTIPIILKIWGGNSFCAKAELLAKSPLITDTNWLDFNFIIKPKTTIKYILFEVFYQTPTLFPYCGNILLDNASSFVEITVDNEKKPNRQNDD